MQLILATNVNLEENEYEKYTYIIHLKHVNMVHVEFNEINNNIKLLLFK
jgi:hypothetical protein